MTGGTEQTTPGPLKRLAGWVRDDIDRACSALVLSMLGSIALAGSATHILHVGEYPQVQVTGWMVWTVAGSLEVLGAYAAWEIRRRAGFWDRVIPALVLTASFAFILLANLAAADPASWFATEIPWAQLFAVAPPVGFISVSAIAETRGWQRPRRRPKTTARRDHVTTRDQGQAQDHGQGHDPKNQQFTGRIAPAAAGLADVPGVTRIDTAPPAVEPGEDRGQTVTRWISEGHRYGVMVAAGIDFFGVSEPTMKRVIRDARREAEGSAEGEDRDPVEAVS